MKRFGDLVAVDGIDFDVQKAIEDAFDAIGEFNGAAVVLDPGDFGIRRDGLVQRLVVEDAGAARPLRRAPGRGAGSLRESP